MSLDKALDELMDGDIIVFQKYVSLEGPQGQLLLWARFWDWEQRALTLFKVLLVIQWQVPAVVEHGR